MLLTSFIPFVLAFAGGAAVAALALRPQLARAHERARMLEILNKGIEERLRTAGADLEATRTELGAKASELAAAQSRIEAERAGLPDLIRSLSSKALEQNGKQFLELAEQHFGKIQKTAEGELERRTQAVDSLVKPFAESLEQFRKQVGDIEKQRERAYGSLLSQLTEVGKTHQSLRDETGHLVSALRSPNVRGRWGEIQLQRCVELARIQTLCTFNEKLESTEDGKRKIPDLVVQLPAKKIIVVDSKVPLVAFDEAHRATDDATRSRKLEEHAAHVRKHINALNQKAYWDLQQTPEFTVLFLPGEQYFGAALDSDPHLTEYAAERNIIIATPTTLIAMLRAVYYGWRHEQLADNAQKVSVLGAALYKRLGTVAKEIATLGTSLGKSVESYNKAVSSLETRVLVSARQFKGLHVSGSDDDLIELNPIERIPRELSAPELTDPKLPTFADELQPELEFPTDLS